MKNRRTKSLNVRVDVTLRCRVNTDKSSLKGHQSTVKFLSMLKLHRLAATTI